MLFLAATITHVAIHAHAQSVLLQQFFSYQTYHILPYKTSNVNNESSLYSKYYGEVNLS